MLAQIRWLLQRYWPRHSASGTPAPHCGADHGQGSPAIAIGAPHCGADHGSPDRGETLERADAALAALARTWSDTVALSRPTSAKEIARAFHRCLSAQPDLVGLCVPSEWIRAHYPIFCKWLGLNWAPPYKDFARELAFLMPRERQETWRDGRRVRTRTIYFVALADTAQAAPANPQSESSVGAGTGSQNGLVPLSTAGGYRDLAPSPEPLLRLGAMAKAGHTAH